MQLHFDHLSEEVLASDKYLVEMLGILDILAGERETSEMRRSVRAALYEGSRRSDESLAQYGLRRDSQFSQASRYLPLPSELKAVMLEEQANLSKQGLQNLRVLTGGKNDYETVRKAMQLMDIGDESLFKSSGKPSYLTSEVFEEKNEDIGDKEDDSDDEETFFFAVEEMNLGEDEALVFLADWKTEGFKGKRRSWSENKKLKMAQRKDRRHFEEGGRLDKPPHRRKLSIQELKRVTKCANCGERGHWREDCRKAFKPKGAGGSGGVSAPNAFVFLGNSSQSSSPSFFGVATITALAENPCFLMLPGGHAIVDPGASQDLIGLKSYERLKQQLGKVGLQTIELSEEPCSASGIGGKASSVLTALCPCVLGGVPGIIKLTVVAEDVPQLLSVGLLELTGAVIHVSSGRVVFENFGKEMTGKKLETGHLTLDITEWPGGIFPVPQQVSQEHGVQPGDFNLVRGSAQESYVLLPESDEGLIHGYLHEVTSPEGFRGWTIDPMGNSVLVSNPGVGFRKPPKNVMVGKFRSTWQCSCDSVVGLESCVDWRSPSVQSNSRSPPFMLHDQRSLADVSTDVFPVGVHVTVFHENSREEFFKKLHELFCFSSPLPRDPSEAQGEHLIPSESSPGKPRVKFEGYGASSEAAAERECQRLCQGSLVLDGEEVAEASSGALQPSLASGESRLWRTREDGDSADLIGENREAGDHYEDSLSPPREHGDLRRKSTRHVEALSGMSDKDPVCSIRAGKPITSISKEECHPHDLCGQGSSDSLSTQGLRGKQLLWGHGISDGANHDESEQDVVGRDDRGHVEGGGSSGAGAEHAGSESFEHGTAAVSHSAKSAGSASELADSEQRCDPHSFRRRGHVEHRNWCEFLEAGGSQVMGLTSFVEALGVSPCTEDDPSLDQWVVQFCDKQSSCVNDFCGESSGYFLQLRGELSSFNFLVWWDPQLVGELCFGDINDDKEFHLPRKVKKGVRRSIESFLARKHGEINLTPETNQKGDFQQTATDEDGRTSEPTGSNQEGESQQTATDEDGRTSEPKRPSPRLDGATRLSGAKDFLGDHWHNQIPSELPSVVGTGLISDAVRAVASAPVASLMAHGSADRSKFKILELFSPPRLVPLASRAGFGSTEPSSFAVGSFSEQKIERFSGRF